MTDHLNDHLDELLNTPQRLQSAILGRLISTIERGGDEAVQVERAAFLRSGSSYVVGITGAPGAGKSSLIGGIVQELRRRDTRVAVLAVDPTSPFSGGAILGDRVRMLEHSLDDGVFIRSMATRGRLGGLALATPAVARLLDAAGFDVVLIETVGVGQVELEIADVADTTVVVVTPGWGDEVQAAKAGLLEIADVFTINKADRAEVAETRRHLQQMLHARSSEIAGWTPPIVETVASEAKGVADVVDEVWCHRTWLEDSDALAGRRAARLWREVERLVVLRAVDETKARSGEREVDDLRRRLVAREIDPWLAADELRDWTSNARHW
jgi:LAO/AO transport system kinase